MVGGIRRGGLDPVSVLIIGGGPVGLCLGIALARAGIAATLVEEREGPTPHPKATLLGSRSMEHFRAWDRLDLKVADAAMRQEEDYFILFCDRLAGHELHRFRSPGLDIETAITELGVGEALVSCLDEKGRPCPTERVFVLPPGSQIGPISAAQRQALIQGSLVAGVYEKTIDRESAHEKLKGGGANANGGNGNGSMADEARNATRGSGGAATAPAEDDGGLLGGLKDMLFGSTGPRGGRRPGLAEAAATSAVRTMGSTVGREIIRGVLGSILGGGSKRRR